MEKDAGAAGKRVFMQAIGNDISLIIEVFTGMVGGKHNQDNTGYSKSEDGKAKSGVESIGQNSSQDKRKNSYCMKRGTGKTDPSLELCNVWILHKTPESVDVVINIKTSGCKGWPDLSRLSSDALIADGMMTPYIHLKMESCTAWSEKDPQIKNDKKQGKIC